MVHMGATDCLPRMVMERVYLEKGWCLRSGGNKGKGGGEQAERPPQGEESPLVLLRGPEGAFFLAAPTWSLFPSPLTCPGSRGEVGMGWGAAASLLSLHLWEGRPRPEGCARLPQPWPRALLAFCCFEGWGPGAPLAPPGLLSHTLQALPPPAPPGLPHFCFPQILIKALLCTELYTNHLKGTQRKKRA